jgi:hypothetical protein
MLYLTSGRADWLSGRFVYFTIRPSFLFLLLFINVIGRFCSANWDMEEVVRGHLSAVIFDLRVTPDCS